MSLRLLILNTLIVQGVILGLLIRDRLRAGGAARRRHIAARWTLAVIALLLIQTVFYDLGVAWPEAEIVPWPADQSAGSLGNAPTRQRPSDVTFWLCSGRTPVFGFRVLHILVVTSDARDSTLGTANRPVWGTKMGREIRIGQRTFAGCGRVLIVGACGAVDEDHILDIGDAWRAANGAPGKDGTFWDTPSAFLRSHQDRDPLAAALLQGLKENCRGHGRNSR